MVHAFVVLATHFHLLVTSCDGRLDRAMAWIQSRYVQRFNREHDRDGPLVRGRFHSKPVESSGYLRTLIAYIDWNPVPANLAEDPVDYEHGSASRFASGRPPRWLSRRLVDAEVCARSPSGTFDLDVYRELFRPTASQVELVEERLRSRAIVDRSGDVLTASGPRLEAWLLERAQLADGDPRRIAPLVGPTVVQKTVAALAGGDVPPRGPRGGDRRAVLEVGLLRQLSSATFSEIALRMRRSRGRISMLWQAHRHLLATDPEYRRVSTDVATRLLRERDLVTDQTGSKR